MAAPDPKRSTPPPQDAKRTLSGKLTLLAIAAVVLAYLVTIVVGVATGGAR